MSLPQVDLDDRRFQDLVNEARTRVARACPEWTEHNVSDPGITLIELFAWMTDMLVYRLNRVPDKVHVALLELLGIARLFDGVLNSADLGVAKPDVRAYAAAHAAIEAHLGRGLGHEQVWFTDDRIDNVAAAREFGWSAELFTLRAPAVTPEA